MKQPPSLENPIEAVRRVAADLRDPEGGCPWDLKQDHKSLIKHLIEEAYEVVDSLEALTEKNISTYDALKEELGDLFFQIVLHSQLASEKKYFDLDEVSISIVNKLIFRHPHVYGKLSNQGLSTEAVLQNWEALKKEERLKDKDHSGKKKSMLSGIPKSMPALLKAYRLGQKVSRVGFDWENLNQIEEKIKEEIHEFREELISSEKSEKDDLELIEEEFGDILFVLCQYARHVQIDPERALQKANKKFIPKDSMKWKRSFKKDQTLKKKAFHRRLGRLLATSQAERGPKFLEIVFTMDLTIQNYNKIIFT